MPVTTCPCCGANVVAEYLRGALILAWHAELSLDGRSRGVCAASGMDVKAAARRYVPPESVGVVA